METKTKIILVSSDGEKFEISHKAAQRSILLKNLIEEFPEEAEVPLDEIKSNILKKIKEYLEHYENEEPKEIERPLPSPNFKKCVNSWDYKYIDIDLEMLFELVNAVNYLDIEPLLELGSAKVASIIKGKTAEEIKKILNIDVITPEEREIIEENKLILESY